MKTYLVTGTEGFIGKSVKINLVSKGNDVICIDRNFITENPSWEKSLKEIFLSHNLDGVFHIGACADTLSQDVNEMMLLNYYFTKELADLCLDQKVKMVFSSSAACYGNRGTPENLYAWSKLCAENYLVSIGKAVSLRYFNVFGPGEENKGRMSSVAFQAFSKILLRKEASEMILFPGKPKRDFVHIDDVVDSNIYAMENIAEGTVWDVGCGDPISFETVMNIFGIPYNYSSEENIPVGYQFYTCSHKWMPGWNPKMEINSRFESYRDYLLEIYRIDNTQDV